MPSVQYFDITGIIAPLIPYCDQDSPDYHPKLDEILTGEPPYDFGNISTDELTTLRKDLLLVWLEEANLDANNPIIPLLNDVIQALPRVIPVTNEEKDQKRSFENDKAFLRKFGSTQQTNSAKVPQPASSAPAPSAHVANAFLPPRQATADAHKTNIRLKK